MSYACGQAVEIADVFGAVTLRLTAQCGGHFLITNHVPGAQPPNGLVLYDWRAVARELVALCVPGSLDATHGKRARGPGRPFYVDMRLTFPLQAAQMAALLDEDEADVRAELEGLRVAV